MAKYYIPLVGTPQIGNGGGGSDLPDVTSEDNGDVLTVVNGTWDKAAPSGGGGVLVVNVTETDDAFVCDKTAAEMFDAYKSGGVVLKATVGTIEDYTNIVFAFYNDGDYAFGTYQTDTYEASSGTDYPVCKKIT